MNFDNGRVHKKKVIEFYFNASLGNDHITFKAGRTVGKGTNQWSLALNAQLRTHALYLVDKDL